MLSLREAKDREVDARRGRQRLQRLDGCGSITVSEIAKTECSYFVRTRSSQQFFKARFFGSVRSVVKIKSPSRDC